MSPPAYARADEPEERASAMVTESRPSGDSIDSASDSAEAVGERLKAWWSKRGRWLTLESVLLFLFCTAVVVWLYEAWRQPRVPMFHAGDARLVQMYVKNTLEHGWWWSNPDLAAPYGAWFLDLPHGGEHLQFLLLKILGTLLGNDLGLTLNVYYLGGFGLTAVGAHLVMRHLGFAWHVSALVGVAFTFLPYHFGHAMPHLWRSVYPNVPLMVLLTIWCVTPREAFLADPEATDERERVQVRGNLRWGRISAAVVIAVAIAIWETMMVAFGLSVLAGVVLVVALRQRRWGPLVAGGAVAVVMLGTFAVHNIPSVLYAMRHGDNEMAVRRDVVESEALGLKLNRMLLPDLNHRVREFRRVAQKAVINSPVPSENGQSLGALGVAGFLGAAFVFLGKGMPRRPRPIRDRDQLVRLSGLSALGGVLLGTIGGLAFILSIIGFSQVRVWNRISILIAFFSFLALAVGLERLHARMRPLNRGPLLIGALMVSLLAFNLWDTTIGGDYDGEDQHREELRGFLPTVEAQLEPGAAIFQLPVVPFPENPPVHGMTDYDHLAPYIESESLRWSYGAIKGRDEAGWQDHIPMLPTEDALGVLVGMGFDGLWIDRFGYEDLGAEIESEFAAVLGPPQESGRYAFFNLVPWAEADPRSPEEFRAYVQERINLTPPE